MKIIPSDHKEVIRALVRFKEGLETVEGYDHIPVPPVYSQVTGGCPSLPLQNISDVGEQVVYVATYSYFILSLIGYQQLNSEPEILFPVFLVLKFVFFIGWLKV